MSGRARILFFAILALAVVAAYGSSLQGAFVLDDRRVLVESTALSMDRLSLESVKRLVFESRSADRPVANATFALNHYAFGPSRAAYRAVNVLLHLVNAALVFFLVSRVFRLGMGEADALWLSGPTALLWAVHPVHPQAVTYIVQRMTLLGALFILLAMLSGIRWLEREGSGSGRWGVLAGAFCLLGLFSKQIAIVAPGLIALYALSSGQAGRGGRLSARAALVGAAIATVLLAAAYFGYMELLAANAGGPRAAATGSGFDRYGFGPLERVMTEWRVTWFYAGLILWPSPGRIAFDHDFTVSSSLLSPPETILALAGILGALAAAFALRYRLRPVAFLIAWFLANLALESSPLPLDLVAEYRAYLPSLAVIGLVLYAAYAACARIPRGRWAYAAIVVLALAVSTGWTRTVNARYVSERALWEDVLSKSPGCARGWLTLGRLDFFEGKARDAVPKLREAVRLDAKSASARVTLGNVLAEIGERDQAEAVYLEALGASPGDPALHYNLAVLYRELGREGDALRQFGIFKTLSSGTTYRSLGAGDMGR